MLFDTLIMTNPNPAFGSTYKWSDFWIKVSNSNPMQICTSEYFFLQHIIMIIIMIALHFHTLFHKRRNNFGERRSENRPLKLFTIAECHFGSISGQGGEGRVPRLWPGCGRKFSFLRSGFGLEDEGNSLVLLFYLDILPHSALSWNFSFDENLANLQDGPQSGIIIYLVQPPSQPATQPPGQLHV